MCVCVCVCVCDYVFFMSVCVFVCVWYVYNDVRLDTYLACASTHSLYDASECFSARAYAVCIAFIIVSL